MKTYVCTKNHKAMFKAVLTKVSKQTLENIQLPDDREMVK